MPKSGSKRALDSQPNLPFPVKKRSASTDDKAQADQLQEILRNARKIKTRSGWNVGEALDHLLAVDPLLARHIVRHGIPKVYTAISSDEAEVDAFHHLCKVIVFQQLQGKAAQTIFSRLLEALNVAKSEQLSPELVKDAEFKSTEIKGKRKILVNGQCPGLSGQKASYIQSLAEHFSDEKLLKNYRTHIDLTKLSDDELQKKLTAVKGLGLWSVHMYQIFQLHRCDILATGDLGVRKGLCKLHGLAPKSLEGGKKGQEKMREMCAKWSPYSSLACGYMWRIADTADLPSM